MKLFTISTFVASTTLVGALCPYARQALEDPESFERYLAKRDALSESPQANGDSPLSTFSEDQLIDVTGVHAWAPPGEGDLRGPCPGLNALANHGYFPRNGIIPLTVGATATNEVYGLALDFGIPLTAYATLVDGDLVGEYWSIGGPPPPVLGVPLVGKGDGLSGSHNKYESDASPGRGDFYLYNGDVTNLRVEKFKALYDLAKDDPVPNYDIDVITQHRKYTFDQSRDTNPYFFFAPFAGVAVANAAHTFIPRLMSNHSAEYPDGILDKETLKSFFAITEAADGTLTYTPGYERIPDNWYRRPLGVENEYSPASFALDLVKFATVAPEAVSVGGNTGTVSSFTGVDLGDITSGAYHTSDLLDPTKFVCFFYQLTLAVVPDFLRSEALGSALGAALGLLSDEIQPFVDPSCATIVNYNDSFAAQFPGSATD